MADVQHLYEDRWGEIIDRPTTELVELRWYDTTAAMSAEQFQDWLATFAGHVERLRRPRVLVDGTRFMMDPANVNNEWRDANINPRYNAAGVRRFAFLFPDGLLRTAAGGARLARRLTGGQKVKRRHTKGATD
jgi:hypothetical protein